MKHLKLFFALFAMLALNVGHAWGAEATVYTSNVELNTTGGSKAYASKANIANVNYDAMKLGSSGNVGHFYVTVPANTTTLTLHAAAWSGKNSNTLTLSSETTGVTISPSTAQTLTANSGVSGNSTTYTITPNDTKEFFTFSLTGATSGAKIKLACSERCLIWGVNAETAGGGENPGEGGDEDPETPGAGGSGSIVIKYNSTFTPTLPSAKASVNTSSTAHTVEGLNIHEQGIYKGSSNNYLMFVENKGFLYNTQSLGTITSVSVTYTSGTSTAGEAGVYFGSTEQNTYTNTSNQTIAGQSKTDTWTNTTEGNGFFQLSTSNKNVQITQIEITYKSGSEGGGSTEPVLSVSPEKVDFGTKNIYFDSEKKGSLEIDIIGQNLTGNVSAAISEDTDDIFDLSQESFIPNTGEVSEKLTVSYEVSEARDYTATLTLSSDGVEAIELPITLKVINEEPATYVKVTNAVTDGEYLIVYEEGNVAFNGSLTTLDAVSNTVAIEINNNIIVGNTEIDAATFTISAMTEGYAIKAKSGKYIGRTSGSNGMNTDASEIANDITFTDGAVKIAGSGSGSTTSLQYNATSGQTRFRYFTSSQKAIALYKKVDPNEIIEPQFKLAAGEYYGTQSVEITCATAGAEIYYTLNGTDPTSASTKYTGAISISETKTIKAIAVKGANSSAVVSATYTILAPLATMQAIFDKATDATQSVHIKFNDWVISGVVPGKDGKPSSNAYITDGSKGFIIYNKDGHGFNVGNKLSGTVVCDLTRYNGSAEVVGLTSSTEGLTVSTGGVVTPVVVNDVTTLSGVNTGAVIKITGVCETKNINSRDYFYVDGVQLYNSLFAYENPTVGSKYNVTGVYVQYNDVPEVLPRSAADIEEIIDLPTATISIANITMEVGKTKTIEATITPDAAQSTVQYAITAGNEYITLNGTTITAVAAGTATITATIAEVAGEYYGATKTFNVTVKPQDIAVLPFTFTGGKTDIENTLGMSQEGLGSDYSGTTNLRFDNTGDCVVIHFDSEPGQLSYEIKGNSFSGGTFSVQQSADGSTYTEVVTYTELGDAATNEHELAAESRYVKFIYTTKSSGNVGLGNITISKPDNRQEAGLAWNPETVTLTVGDAFTAPTLSNPHSVSGITYESSNEAVATVSAEGVIALVDDATGSATITATFAGDKDYKPATATCTIMVNEDCEGSDDFETATATDASSYNTRTTEAGWEATNAAKITIEGELGTYLAINGKTSAVGTITSPVLNGGIGSIKIRYANKFSESNGVSFRLDIKQNGEVVKTYTITKANDAVVKGTVYTELIENINVAGDFQMVFTNLSPSNDTGNKDRVSIGRLCWTGYEETPQEPKEETIELYDFAWEISDGSLIMSADWNETPVYVEIYNAGETLASGTYDAFLNLGGLADASIDVAEASVELFVWANGAAAEMTGAFVGETTGTKYNLSLTGTMPSGGGEATEYNIEESNVQGVIDPDGNLLLQGETATIMLSAFDPTITEPTNYGATVMYNDYSAYAEGFVTAVTDGTNVEVYGEGLEGEDMTGSAIINAHFVGTILQDGAAVDVEVSDLVVTSDEDLQIAMLSGTGQHLTLGNLTFELYLSNYTGDNVEYQLTSESKVYYIYHSIPKPAAITGSLTKSYSSELNTDVYAGTVTTTIDEQEYEINLTMYYIEPEAVDMTVTNATITLEEGTLFIEGEWNSYPFIILDGLKEWSEDKQYQNINIEVGVWGENYYGMLMQDPTKEFAITVENNTLTFKGYFIKGDNQQLHNVTISGTMPQTVTEITLTEGENNLTNGATGDVTVNRSFIKDNLYTLSLPFALSATQVKAIFGANTVLYQFAKLAKEGDELVLYFSKPSAIAAGTPYLIIPSLDVNAFVVKGATITTNTNNISLTADKTTVTMEPVLSAAASAKTNGTTEYWLAADKYLYNNANTLLSLRALFNITTTSGMPPRCRVALGENVETSLEDLFTTDAPVKVIENGQLIIIRDGVKYNVQGQKL